MGIVQKSMFPADFGNTFWRCKRCSKKQVPLEIGKAVDSLGKFEVSQL